MNDHVGDKSMQYKPAIFYLVLKPLLLLFNDLLSSEPGSAGSVTGHPIYLFSRKDPLWINGKGLLWILGWISSYINVKALKATHNNANPNLWLGCIAS